MNEPEPPCRVYLPGSAPTVIVTDEAELVFQFRGVTYTVDESDNSFSISPENPTTYPTAYNYLLHIGTLDKAGRYTFTTKNRDVTENIRGTRWNDEQKFKLFDNEHYFENNIRYKLGCISSVRVHV